MSNQICERCGNVKFDIQENARLQLKVEQLEKAYLALKAELEKSYSDNVQLYYDLESLRRDNERLKKENLGLMQYIPEDRK